MMRMINFLIKTAVTLYFLLFIEVPNIYAQNKEWLHFKPESNKAVGKKIVLISGDEEYRTEESMPMLAKILTTHHGFETVVLFSINPNTKEIDPEYQKNIPGLVSLKDADLMIIGTRFRALPDSQMVYIDEYLKAGKPVMGFRTATHAFNFAQDLPTSYRHYSYNNKDEVWKGGFGGLVLGETWVNHHGIHGKEGTRALINELESLPNPILKGVKDIWGYSDVYGIKNSLSDATILLLGQPTEGMTSDTPINMSKSTMPIAWTRSYKIPSGKAGKVFVTTMGSSVDFLSKDLRRLLVNATYWSLGQEEKISEDYCVDPVDTFAPTMFGFGTHKKGIYPKDYY